MAKETKAEDLRDLSPEKLAEQLDETREQLMRMRFQKATGELKDQNLPRLTRRKIAQILTVLKEKSAAAPKTEQKTAPKAEQKTDKKPEKKTEGEA